MNYPNILTSNREMQDAIVGFMQSKWDDNCLPNHLKIEAIRLCQRGTFQALTVSQAFFVVEALLHYPHLEENSDLKAVFECCKAKLIFKVPGHARF